MDDVEKRMNEMKQKDSPSTVELHKYIRYLVNVKKLSPEQVYGDVSHWDRELVQRAMKNIQTENSKPRPKRYYVSLKEPLEDSSLK